MSAEQTFATVPMLPDRDDEPRPARPPGDLFGDLVISGDRPRRSALTGLFPASLAIHGILGAAALVLPLFAEETLPDPQDAVHAFFVTEPAMPPAPPPPPPPPPKASVAPRTSVAPKPVANSFVAPIAVPEVLDVASGIDLGIEGGVAGGVAGGVPGGVVGGVVGGLLLEAPPPPEALRIGGEISEPRKLRDVAPVYPDLARQAGIQGIVILECTIDRSGRVTDVRVLRGLPTLDEAAMDAVRQWVYSPTLVDGVPVSVIMTVTVQFKLSGARRGY